MKRCGLSCTSCLSGGGGSPHSLCEGPVLVLVQVQSQGSDCCDCVQGRLMASAVGQIVGLQSQEIKQMVSEYAEKVSRRF